jgi:inner membrane protein involved in colicin E2 resistance
MDAEYQMIGQKIEKKDNIEFKREIIRKSLIIMIFCFVSSITFAQKTVVLETLGKNGVDSDVLDPESFKQSEKFSFDLEQKVSTSGYITVTPVFFDSSKQGGDSWKVKNVNGNQPSQREVKSFRKENSRLSVATQYDDISYKIEEENFDHLVNSSKDDVNTLSKAALFLKNYKNYLTINLQTKRNRAVKGCQ